MRLTPSKADRLVLLSSLILAGCTDAITGPPKELTALPRPLTAAEGRVATSGNAFTFALLKQVSAAQPNDNVFISPLSASMALGMTMNGAAGTTLDAMRTTLGFEQAELAEINAGYKGLIALLRSLDKTTDFRIANSIWACQELSVNPDFVTTTGSFFDAKVTSLDFNAPATLTTINDWVNVATAGKIPHIIDQISDQDVMFLINAIYFKGSWRLAFDRTKTTDDVFHLAGGGTQPMRMMNMDQKVRLQSNEMSQALELLYGNGAFALDVLLPQYGYDVNELIAALTPEEWNARMQSFQEANAMVGLPKFKLEYERNLNEELKALGMSVAFDPAAADFSRMVTGNDRLFISYVKQKTFVDVYEEGTEAAAATAVGMSVTSFRPMFRVDRPFLFAIRERLTGTILFVGKVMRIPGA